ncbi:MAG: cytochrome c biogenesis protein CcsA [Coriobacteriia bacterium]|nr:cytochrome c biogenesis protein CcsA [Coriobacteriia bacterium]
MLLLGQIGLWGGSLAALGAVVLFLMGRKGDSLALSARRGGYYATFLAFLLFTLSVVVIIVGFFTKNFTMQYVAMNHPTGNSSLMWLFNLSGLWAGKEGSLLLWAWIITIFTGFMALKGAPKNDDLNGMALMVLNLIVVVFGAVMLLSSKGANNPFMATPPDYLVNGVLRGPALAWRMSPPLQHWAMILHPPALFIGYAGLSVPLAYAFGALLVGDGSDRWVRECDRTTIFAWLFLTIGIGLGAIWAYTVLGWGGFWGWDPVENASILSWFVGVALIHSFTIYRRKGNFKIWTMMLTAITFVMVIMGTWITRADIVQSVHAFGEVDLVARWVFAVLMLVAFFAMLIAVIYRRQMLHNASDFESLTSKEAGYYFNNLFMVLASVIVAGMTTAPAWLKTTYATTSFETIAHYMGIIYIAIMAVCPLLKWGKTGGKALWDHIKLPLLITIVPFGLLMWNWIANLRPVYTYMVAQAEFAPNFTVYGPRWLYDATAVLGFFLASFLIVNTLFVFIDGARARSKATGDGFGKSLASLFTKARTQSGGMIVHIAVAVIVIGLVGSVMYVRQVNKTVPESDNMNFTIADYSFTLKDKKQTPAANGDVTYTATFDLKKGSQDLGTVTPSVTNVAATGQQTSNAIIKSSMLNDLFISLAPQRDAATGQIASLEMDVRINPLIRFVWIGVGLMMVGTVLADWPKKKPVAVAAPAPVASGGKSGKSGSGSGNKKNRK